VLAVSVDVIEAVVVAGIVGIVVEEMVVEVGQQLA